MIKKILLAVTVLVAGFLIFAATRPETYHVERSTKVEAPAEIVFALVSDFKSFAEWSPWEKLDPKMQKTISTPSSGVGASYAWQGNKDAGKGKMTLTEVTAPTHTRERLEFIEPFASVADTGFDIKPAGASAVTVTWSMDGKNNFMGKAMQVFMNMDKMIGKDFEEGLANIKRLSEAKRAEAAAAAPTAAAPAEAAPAAKQPASAPAKTP